MNIPNRIHRHGSFYYLGRSKKDWLIDWLIDHSSTVMSINVCWQVLLPDEFIDKILTDVSDICDVEEVNFTIPDSYSVL